MGKTVKIRKPNKLRSLEELEKLSKEDLISKIQALEAHNFQLQNIINKSSTTSDSPHNNNFDFTKCHLRHVLLHFFYLGWDYQGFVTQEDTTNTIEHYLFHALTRTCLIKDRGSSNYNRCGRTDKGVSSFGQVISIDIRSKLAPQNQHDLDNEIDYCKILNRVLPDNIQCVAWAPVSAQFSSRFDCTSRTYKYYFPKGNLNIDQMNEACKLLIGSHDLRNFAKMDVGNGVVEFTRKIFDFKIHPLEDDVYVAEIKGNAFLWHQIRYTMGILFLIGSGKENVQVIRELLDVNLNPRKPDYSMASEVPLNLFFCKYDNVNWKTSQDSLQSVLDKLQDSWTMSLIKTTMIKDFINNISGKFNPNVKCPSESLLAGVRSKKYIPVMDRQKGDSLEDKIRHFSKRQRIEVVNENTT